MPFTHYAEQQILDAVFGDRSGTYTVPWTATYLGFSSTTPTKAATSTWNVTEPSGGAYAREQVVAADMDAAALDTGNMAKDNGAAVEFTQATASWVSGADLTHWCLWDASSSGNLLAFGALDVAKPVTEDDTASVPVGNLKLEFADAA
jgi:hypothetical protein